MARQSFQRGFVRLRKRKRQKEGVWVLYYRVRSVQSPTGWTQKSETMPECKTRKEALEVLDKRMSEVNRLNRFGSQSVLAITFQDFASGLWQSYLAKREIKPSTAYSFNSMLNNFVFPELGKQSIDQIGPEQITKLLDNLVKLGKSGKYLLNLYSLLRTMFEVASEYGLVGQSPIKRKLHRPRYRRTEKPALSAEQVRAVLRNVPDDYREIFLCVALTGLRVGELLALRWQDIDLVGSRLSVSHSLWRGQLVSPKTEGSARTVHLPGVLARLLLGLQNKSRWSTAADFVFCRIDGKPWDPDWLRKQVLHPALKAAGIQRTPHAHGFHLFRHSAGSIVHAETGNLKLAQDLLGHSRISTTSDIYVHLDATMAEVATEALAAAIAPGGAMIVQESDKIQ